MKRFFFLCILWFVPLGIARAHHEHSGAAKSAFEGVPSLPIALVIIIIFVAVSVAAFVPSRSNKASIRIKAKKS